ncbi:hypothetical protein TL16_g09708 [Triparma laevis f. inornata]|uniref:MYND-type domain-containing protein n=1 Tax=Triparma laevis f. inornata TaxID=1714386 RepID=A0A9W7B806_9STRA|nr:hypothetical protein TL16_g09708 [Triparma laevis f. inornata]
MPKPKGPQNTLDFHTLLNSTCALELLASLALATTPSAVISAQNSGRKTILAFLKRSLAEGGGGLGDADDVWLGTAVEVCLQKVVQMHDDMDDDRDDREELKEKEAAQRKLAVKEQIHQIKIEHKKEMEAQVPHQSSQLMTFKDPNILKPRPPFSNTLYNEITCSDLPCDVCGVNSVRYGCVRCECRFYCGEECYLKDKVEHYKECSIEDVKLSKATGNRMKSIKVRAFVVVLQPSPTANTTRSTPPRQSVDPIYHWDFRLKPVLDSPSSPTLCQYTNTPCNVMNKAHKTKDGLVCGPTFGYGEIDGLITVPRNFSIEVKLRFDIPQNEHYKPAKSDRYEVGTIFDFRSSSSESPNHSTPILFNTKPLFAESEEEDLEKSFGAFTPEVLEKAKSELNRDVEMTRLLTRRR